MLRAAHIALCLLPLLLAPPGYSQQPDTPAAGPRVFQSLECFPARIQLSSIRDSRRFLVTGTTADGQKIDLTADAKASSTAPCFTVDADGYLTPVATGEGKLIIAAAGLQLEVPVAVDSVCPV
ncbi:MAG: hypothetical protein ACKOEO_05200, partial [Planctomycetaceae bacterium]